MKRKAGEVDVVGSWVLHLRRNFDDEMVYHQNAGQNL